MCAVSRCGAERTWPTCSYPNTGSPVSSTCRICASMASASRPGWISAIRRPSRSPAGPPPNCSRAAFDHTQRRFASTIAMPTGDPVTICSSTERLMSQPGAPAMSHSSTSQRCAPPGSDAGVTRTMTLTCSPPLRRAVSSPAQPPSLRHRSASSGSRTASSSCSSPLTPVPTTSAAAYLSSRWASCVQLITTPRASSNKGTASATSNRCRATSCSS